jgi:7-carboxy-7-deazaguanine synthase
MRCASTIIAHLVDIETNGSIVPSDALIDRIDYFVVSPKFAHSGNDAELALKPDALRRYRGDFQARS